MTGSGRRPLRLVVGDGADEVLVALGELLVRLARRSVRRVVSRRALLRLDTEAVDPN